MDQAQSLRNTSITVAAGGINDTKLATGAVTNVKLGADAITTDKIALGAVESSDIKNGTILGEDIAPATVGAGNLTSGTAANGTVATANGNGGVTYAAPSVTAGNVTGTGNIESTDITVSNGQNSALKTVTLAIAQNAVTSAKIANGTIIAEDLASNSVTTAKIENGTILGEDIAAKTVTASNLNATGATAGNVATANADGTVRYHAATECNLASKRSSGSPEE
ncbi:hypothetical protein AMR72_06270 [Flavobacterium psychrophilum]|nr:hypothetical protein AMR72_06270 [Flavobacterium psychrophilum]AOE52156.1 hypothetical protein ALW18_06260 [Flavobacterium psychrophilum]